MVTESAKIDCKGISIFLAIAFGLAWPIITVGDYLWDSATAAVAVHSMAMLAPGLACVAVRRWVRKGDFQDIGTRAAGWRAYVLVVLMCLLLWGIPRAIDLTLGGDLRAFSSKRALLAGALLLFGLIPAFGEELGWRGYLLPSLLAIGRRKALLLSGIIWGVWHWPLLFASLLRGDINAAQCILGMIAMLPVTAALGVVVGWLWLRFGSILLVSVWHFSYDLFRDLLSIWFEPGRYFDSLSMIPVAVIGGGALLVLLSRIRRLEVRKEAYATVA